MISFNVQAKTLFNIRFLEMHSLNFPTCFTSKPYCIIIIIIIIIIIVIVIIFFFFFFFFDISTQYIYIYIYLLQ